MNTARSCPKCGQNAPIVLRGVEAFCTVCNARRTPFGGDILNLAGTPERIGGHAARWFGWGAMSVGLFVAFTVGLVVQAIASMITPGSWLGLAVGLPIALLSVVLGLTGIIGGNKLGRAGEARLLDKQRDIIRALAGHQRGVVKVSDAARALGVDEPRADSVLGALAREPAENISLDIDDDGNVIYLFGSTQAIRWRIQAERAGITDADREALEAELAHAANQAEPRRQ
jgi:hypothetical protein